MAKRGFFAEIQHQQKVAARQREQAQRAAARQHAAAVRQAEAAQRQAQRAYEQAQRAAATERKAAEAEAKRMHIAAREAEVESMNAKLAEAYEQLDSLLAATLDVDDYVDLEQLRVKVEHPPFPRPDLLAPVPAPAPVQPPPEPQWVEPPVPTGLSGALGGKRRYEQMRTRAWYEYCTAHQAWQTEVAEVPARQLQQLQVHQAAEAQRTEELSKVQHDYDAECAARQAEVDERNGALDELIAGLETGAEPAVQEYIGIVLGNSVYPAALPVEARTFSFDAELRELTLDVVVPGPDTVPTVKAFKFTKSSDEITSTDLPQKAQKDRYASIVHQVALRSVHEIFEADRRECISTIALTVGTEALNPATGKIESAPLVALATDRERFGELDLSQVVPQMTLQHLGALVSKNPAGLVAIDTSKGVRR